MSKNTPAQDAVVCKPTKWFLWRALAMLAMFSVFAFLFFQDGMWGYREKNLHFYVHQAFVKAGTDFQEMQNEKADSKVPESEWKEFAAKQKVQLPEDAADVLPKDADTDMAWPDILVNGHALMSESGGQNGATTLWEQYTASMKDVEGKAWDIDPGEHPMDAGKIREQFIAMGVAMLLIAITLFFLIRTLSRSISADNEALYTQTGKRIPYTDMVRVDKRKWDSKGLALIYYTEGGEEKKAKIDGLVYGQFKAEDGAPAEKLFSKIMENFKGEVMEYVLVDEADDDESQESSSKVGDNSAEA
ncbi:hypothetical protein NT6N_38650 [Oceaniferula spumae]|uniref:Uncharacterized protein n=1 Tax=Oceaniferula spumae TaxID=2979115 RepID=A0AAT9FSC4_9BACT